MKRAFTLVELLVVIGIIAILMATLLAFTGGSTESARAAKCLANMHSLANAANACAMEQTYYPLAGSREVIGLDTVRKTSVRDEQVGWISWLSNKGDPYGKRTGAPKPTEHQSVEVCPFYGTGTREDAVFAITNGALWRYVGKNHDVYICPSHALCRSKKSMKEPQWSYAMNMKFGYDYSRGEKCTGTTGSKSNYAYGKMERADRVLMFAELPTVDPSTGEPLSDGSLDECDCVLHYSMTVDGNTYGGSWKGKTETIGFNHKLGKRGRCGHIAFADGHVEKVVWGKNSEGGLKPEELTVLLCEGVDVAFDGSQWKKASNQD